MRLAPAIVWLSDRLRLSREGVFWLLLCLALLATGLFKSINLITLLACVLLAGMAINFVLARRQVTGLVVVRDVPELANIGEAIRWQIRVRPSDGRARLGIHVRDPGCDGTTAIHRFVEQLPADGLVLETLVEPSRRGIHTLSPVTIASGHPLGLAATPRTYDVDGQLVVAPRLGVVHRGRLRHWFSRTCVRGGTVRAFARRHPGAQTEFHGLRTFRAGDNPRAIHWPTSARKNVLMVRDFEEYPNDDLVLLVDLTVTHADQPHRLVAFERMLSVAASIFREWCRQKGDRLTLVLAGKSPEILNGATGAGLLGQAYRMLATARHEPRIDDSLAALRDHPLPPTAHLLLSVGPSRLPEAIHDLLHQPMATVDVMAGEEAAFFENA
jgi:uncharacterized protein (DUF58 family)